MISKGGGGGRSKDGPIFITICTVDLKGGGGNKSFLDPQPSSQIINIFNSHSFQKNLLLNEIMLNEKEHIFIS